MSHPTRLKEEVRPISSDAEDVSDQSRLLRLPLEVRLGLYDLLLALPSRDHLNLLCLNKQVYGEARESFYRRPLPCDSQYGLIGLVARWPDSVLQSITNLQLNIEKISSEVMQNYLVAITSGSPVQAYRHPYLLEIKQITSTLSKVPNLTRLKLLRPRSIEMGMPSSIVVTQVLNWAAEHYPGLQSLRIDIEKCHIDCLEYFAELRSLRLTGFSETSPTRTAGVLGKLSHLEELIIAGPPRGLQTLQRHGCQTKIVQSVTHQVFERVTPLRRLTLVEISEIHAETSVFLTSKMMKALYDVHRHSLRVLKISASTAPSEAFVEYLSACLLGMTNIEELSLTWPDMEITFVDCIPNSVRSLELAVASRDKAQATLDHLLLMVYRLRYLRDIKFHIINPVHEMSSEQKEDDSSPHAFSMPIQNVAAGIKSPFKVSWGIWQPVMSD